MAAAFKALVKGPSASYIHPFRLISLSISFKIHSCTFSSHQPFSLSNSQTVYRKQILLASLLQKFGFPASDLQSFLSRNRFLLERDVSEIEKSMGVLLFSLKLPQTMLILLIRGCPSVLDFPFLKKWEKFILSSKILQDAPSAIASTIKCSRRFQREPGDYIRHIQIMKDLGFTDGTISRVFQQYPEVVTIDARELQRRRVFLTSVGLGGVEVDRICFFFPQILSYRIEDRLKPLLNEFDQMFDGHLWMQEIVKEPRILSFELGELQRCLELLKCLNFRQSVEEQIFEHGELRAAFAVKQRVDFLCDYGLTRRDALYLLRKEPRAIVYDIKDIEKKVEFMLERMKFNISCLIEVPSYLGLHFEKQIVPRYSVIEYLRSMGGIGFEVRLSDIMKPSRLRFYNFYVKPYPECEKIYGRFSNKSQSRSSHPPGLWKLLQPQTNTREKEDVENIRSFMEL